MSAQPGCEGRLVDVAGRPEEERDRDDAAPWWVELAPEDFGRQLAARSVFGCAQWWRRACALGCRVPAGPGIAPGLVGLAFADLPDPVAPLLALWNSGYAMDSWDDDGIALVMPDLPPETSGAP